MRRYRRWTMEQKRAAVERMSYCGHEQYAKCESFIKTLKQEEIYTREYRDRAELETRVSHFLEQYYNRQRLHSALNYHSPEHFEQAWRRRPAVLPAASMSFFRHEEIYRPDVVKQPQEEP